MPSAKGCGEVEILRDDSSSLLDGKHQSYPASIALRAMATGLLLLVLGACRVLDGVSPDSSLQPSANPITVDTVTRDDRMVALARQQHPRILATYGGEYSDPQLERMVARVIGSLTLDPDNPDQTYQITILDSPNINAFALPGGYLYLTRGLLSLANDSAELAAVVAHEMAHVTADHGIQRQQREAEEQLASQVADMLGEQQSTRIALVRGQLRLAQFSRNQELEADAVGIRSLGRAGYDPYAAARFLQSMAAHSEFRSDATATNPNLDFFASHPSAPRRIELAQQHARQFGPPGTGRRERDSFLQGLDGLLFGDTPENGYVRGRTFLHPQKRIQFAVPEGFSIENSAAAVTATGPNDIAVRFDDVDLDAGQSLSGYIRSGWVAGLDEGSVRSLTVNGNEAANARASADGWQFDITIIRIDNTSYRLLTAAPRGSDALDSVAARVRSTFRGFSSQEAAQLRPLRIRIVEVQPDDSVASLAARMEGVDRRQETFRLLNGLSSSAAVSAGTRVKIITDR